MTSPEAWVYLADEVRKRMEELGMRSRRDLTKADGPSEATLDALFNAPERGGQVKRFQETTMAKFDHALQWDPGSTRQVLQGGHPTPRRDGPGQVQLPAGVGVVVGEEGAAIVLRISRSATSGKSPAELEEALHAAAAEYYRVLREQGR